MIGRTAAALSLALVSACAHRPGPAAGRAGAAPAAARAVDILSFYSGDWREIARTPARDGGCVAGVVRFSHTPDGGLWESDSCRVGSPDGREKAAAGPTEIVDPPTNAEFRTRYRRLGGLADVARTRRVLDHGTEEGGWFIAATPDFKALSIFTRAPRPSVELRERLVAEAGGLGYDTAKLEFPAQPAACTTRGCGGS